MLRRRRSVLLAFVGVLLTLSVAGTAMVSMDSVGDANRELGRVSRAQRHHQHADMMHDALRADVARARQVASKQPRLDAGVVRRETRRHAQRYRRDLRMTASLQLPAGLARALERLRASQLAYIASAEHTVAAALSPASAAPSAERRFQRLFERLVRSQAAVTARLATAATRTQRASLRQEAQARRMVAASSAAALGGWFLLLFLLHRSVGGMRAALTREAEQRSAAELLQHSLLPIRLPDLPQVQLAARYLPGQAGIRVGGDWYDAFVLPTGELALMVGDVAGHDLPAATVMGQLRNGVRAYALEDTSPASVLTRMNRAAQLLDTADMATCLYAILDTSTHTLRWSSAGHLPPLWLSATGRRRLLCQQPGPPLGATDTAEYDDHMVHLQPGDSLLLYTDGLVERRGESITAGLARLEQPGSPPPSPQELCDLLLDGRGHDAHAADDVTLLLMQLTLGRPQRGQAWCLDGDMTSREERSRVVSASRDIAADAGRIFELIADPAQQPRWDGNDNLAGAGAGQRVRALGDVFIMETTKGKVRENHVVEFDEGRLIAWTPAEPGQEPPGHLWRWELESIASSRTRVTHTYDWTRLTDEKRFPRARSTTSDKLRSSIDRLATLAESG